MKCSVLTDEDVHLYTAECAARGVAVLEQSFRCHHARTLEAPARFGPELSNGHLTFTLGNETSSSVIGFRVYDLVQVPRADPDVRGEVTAVFSTQTGALHGVVLGPQLGRARTGCIGGVAIKHLSLNRPHMVLGVVGTGHQACTQLAAALAVRSFREVRVFSRNVEKCANFAQEMSTMHGVRVVAVDSAEKAVREADVVITCTNSASPVIKAAWLKKGAHLNHIGPNFKDEHEIGIEFAAAASRLVTDSLQQRDAFGERFTLHGEPANQTMIELSSIVAGANAGRRDEHEITIFYSLGLAGTEVLLARDMMVWADHKSNIRCKM